MGSTKIIDQVRNLLQRKVDSQEFEDLIKTKTSKKDHEMSLQTISKLNNQLSSAMQLVSQLTKMVMDNESGKSGAESKNQRLNNIANLYHQAVTVQKWIQQSNNNTINESFTDNLKLPQDVVQFNIDLKAPNLPLSPNKKSLNEKIKNTTKIVEVNLNQSVDKVTMKKMKQRGKTFRLEKNQTIDDDLLPEMNESMHGNPNQPSKKLFESIDVAQLSSNKKTKSRNKDLNLTDLKQDYNDDGTLAPILESGNTQSKLLVSP